MKPNQQWIVTLTSPIESLKIRCVMFMTLTGATHISLLLPLEFFSFLLFYFRWSAFCRTQSKRKKNAFVKRFFALVNHTKWEDEEKSTYNRFEEMICIEKKKRRSTTSLNKSVCVCVCVCICARGKERRRKRENAIPIRSTWQQTKTYVLVVDDDRVMTMIEDRWFSFFFYLDVVDSMLDDERRKDSD